MLDGPRQVINISSVFLGLTENAVVFGFEVAAESRSGVTCAASRTEGGTPLLRKPSFFNKFNRSSPLDLSVTALIDNRQIGFSAASVGVGAGMNLIIVRCGFHFDLEVKHW